jgi:2-oxoglutarate ferredoxin oxidoreductase subunit beta
MQHPGAAFIDCLSPCVQFNNHQGSTKNFDYVREHNEAVNRLDYITSRSEISADYAPGSVEVVVQHDGGVLRLCKLAADYNPHDRTSALAYLQERTTAGEIVTGLLYLGSEPEDLHHHLNTVATPLNALDDASLCPGSAALASVNAALRY